MAPVDSQPSSPRGAAEESQQRPGPLAALCGCAAVTGASGFNGAFLVQELFNQGVRRIKALDVRRNDHLGVVAEGERLGRIEWVDCNITNEAQVASAMEGVDVVYHCASYFGSPPFATKELIDPSEMARMKAINVDGTQNLLRAAAKRGVRAFVYTSSTAATAAKPRDLEFVDEDCEEVKADDFVDLYSCLKWQGEQMVRAFDGTNGMRTVCLRPMGLWGPSMTATALLMGMELILWPLPLGPKGGVIGTNSLKIDWTHVGNLCNAEILSAIKCIEDGDRVGGQAYHITDGHQEKGNWHFAGRFLSHMGAHHYPLLPVAGLWVVRLISIQERICFYLSRLLFPKAPLRPSLTMMQSYRAAHSATYSIERARRDLGYAPLPVDPLVEETAEFMRVHWSGQHFIRPVHLGVWATLLSTALFTTFLAFGEHRWAGGAPWKMTRSLIGGILPSVSTLSVQEFQRSVGRCIFWPLAWVRLGEGALALHLAASKGSKLAPLWSGRTLLLGYAQLRHLLEDRPPLLQWSVCLGTLGLWIGVPLFALSSVAARK